MTVFASRLETWTTQATRRLVSRFWGSISLRGRRLKGKGKGFLGVRETRGARACYAG